MASGNQGKDWKYGEVDVTINPPSGAIYFEAELDDYNYGDIALDKIRMKRSQCVPSMSKPCLNISFSFKTYVYDDY
jgi:hypothetical protein